MSETAGEASRAGHDARKRWLMAWDLETGWLISRKLKSSVQNGIVGGLLGGLERKKISLLCSLRLPELMFGITLEGGANFSGSPEAIVQAKVDRVLAPSEHEDRVENGITTLQNADFEIKCKSSCVTVCSVYPQLTSLFQIRWNVVVCVTCFTNGCHVRWHRLKAQCRCKFNLSSLGAKNEETNKLRFFHHSCPEQRKLLRFLKPWNNNKSVWFWYSAERFDCYIKVKATNKQYITV